MDSGWCSSQEISAIWDAFGTEPLGHTLLHVPELESSESTVTLGGSPLHQLILSMLVGILCVTMGSYKMIMYRIYFVCWNLPAYSKGPPKSPKPLASVLMTWKATVSPQPSWRLSHNCLPRMQTVMEPLIWMRWFGIWRLEPQQKGCGC